MARVTKYGIRELHKHFPTSKSCLEFIFDSLHTRECSCGGTYVIRLKRKLFQCSRCHTQISPTAGTIFHKSSTPLILWFHALLMFSNAKSGISAKQLERHLAVTYKCAWRMLSLIRKTLIVADKRLQGYVESDGAYFGGRKKAGKDNVHLNQSFRAKTVALGALERGGDVKVSVVPNLEARTIEKFIMGNVHEKSFLLTDGARGYRRLGRNYDHHTVDHHKGEYARDYVHVNSMENFWSHTKRSITGIYKKVSKKHYQSYFDAYSFLYNNRHNDRKRFEILLRLVLLSAKAPITAFLS